MRATLHTTRWLAARGIGAAGRGVLVAGALALLTIALFEWTWLRPLIQQHVHERSGRSIEFDRLSFGLNRALQPTVRLHNLTIQNAPWAAPRPLVRARELAFSLTWDSLWGDRITVPTLAIADAELDLERQADGRRNWRLTRPDDRGPGRVRVLAVDATRVQARVVHGGIDLALELATEPLAAPRTLPAPQAANAPPLTKALRLHGTRAGQRFELEAEVGDLVTFYDTGSAFALDARLRTPQARLAVQGLAGDLAQFGVLDAHLQAEGRHVEELAALAGRRWSLAPLAVAIGARVARSGERWRVDALEVRAGASDLVGSLVWRQPPNDTDPPAVSAVLRSRRVVLDELMRLDLAKADADQPRRLDAWLRRLDADVSLSIGQLDGSPAGPIRAVDAQARLQDGRLTLAPWSAALAGGRVAGRLTLDAGRAPVEGGLDVTVERLGAAQLLAGSRRQGALEGQIDAALSLRGRGDTWAELGRSASGTVRTTLTRASIPVAAEAQLALDLGGWLRSSLHPGERSAVTCAALELGFDRGKGTIRRFGFETERVALAAHGGLDLARGHLDVMVTPQRKRAALLARDKSIRLDGPFDGLRTRLVDPPGPPGAAAAGACDNRQLSSH